MLEHLLMFLGLARNINAALVLLCVLLLGISAGIIGAFLVLRRRALVSDAIAHAALPGVASAFLFGALTGLFERQLLPLLVGASIWGLLAILVLQYITAKTRLNEDVAIGAVLSVFFGFGVVLLSVIQQIDVANRAGLNSFIFGQAAALNYVDANLLAFGALIAIAFALFLLKEFRLLCFDPEFAKSQGWPTQLLDGLLLALVVLVVAVGIQSVGMILVVAVLIIPPVTARFWTERFSILVLLSAVFGGFGSVIGAGLSAEFPDFPAGAVIVLTLGVLFVGSLLIAPSRGLLAVVLRNFKLALKVARDHWYRQAYQTRQRSNSEDKLDLTALNAYRSLSKLLRFLLLGLGFLRREIFYYRAGQYWSLTPKGVGLAAILAKQLEAWESYLVTRSSQALDANTRAYIADLVEHIELPKEKEFGAN